MYSIIPGFHWQSHCSTWAIIPWLIFSCFHSDSADKVVQGGGKFEEIVVASNEITASTVQLVSVRYYSFSVLFVLFLFGHFLPSRDTFNIKVCFILQCEGWWTEYASGWADIMNFEWLEMLSLAFCTQIVASGSQSEKLLLLWSS